MGAVLGAGKAMRAATGARWPFSWCNEIGKPLFLVIAVAI
jgi:hypothetical protein